MVPEALFQRDERRLPDALALLDRAWAIYRGASSAPVDADAAELRLAVWSERTRSGVATTPASRRRPLLISKRPSPSRIASATHGSPLPCTAGRPNAAVVLGQIAEAQKLLLLAAELATTSTTCGCAGWRRDPSAAVPCLVVHLGDGLVRGDGSRAGLGAPAARERAMKVTSGPPSPPRGSLALHFMRIRQWPHRLDVPAAISSASTILNRRSRRSLATRSVRPGRHLYGAGGPRGRPGGELHPAGPLAGASGAVLANTATLSGGGDPTCPVAAHFTATADVAVDAPELTLATTASATSFAVGVAAAPP